MDLSALLQNELASVLTIFCRIGAALMVVPIFGEQYILARSRLGLALIISVVLALPQPIDPGILDDDYVLLLQYLAAEVITGLYIGLIARIVIVAANLAGGVISLQAGLASASFFDPNQGAQSNAISSLLTMMILMLLLVADGHHYILRSIHQSYVIIPPFELLSDDMARLFSKMSALAFEVATKISAPLLVIGLLLNLVTGIINRLMPSFQVMFVILPLQIALGLIVMLLTTFITMKLLINLFEQSLHWLQL